jgi:hypothetical protein
LGVETLTVLGLHTPYSLFGNTESDVVRHQLTESVPASLIRSGRTNSGSTDD